MSFKVAIGDCEEVKDKDDCCYNNREEEELEGLRRGIASMREKRERQAIIRVVESESVRHKWSLSMIELTFVLGESVGGHTMIVKDVKPHDNRKKRLLTFN